MFIGNLRFLLITVFLLLIMSLSACQPESPAAMATETPTVTSTFQPTQTQPTAGATPIPTANFILTDLVGIWTRSDPDRGDLFIVINSDGSYNASHGKPESIVHSGIFSMDGRIFTFIDGWDCSPEETTPGQYILYLTGGKYLRFEPYNDTCPDRPSAFKGYSWNRVEATPTP